MPTIRSATPCFFLVEHLLLLRVQLPYRVEVPDVPIVFKGQSFREICVDEVHVALHRAQHDAHERAHLLGGTLLRLCHGKIRLAQNLAVRARTARLLDHGVKLVEHAVQLLPGLVQKREVLGEADVQRRAGRVKYHRAKVPVRRRLLFLLVRVFGRRLGALDDNLVDLVDEVHSEALAQFGKDAVPERALRPVAFESDEVLVIGIAGDLLDEVAVAELRLVLYDQGA